jgi:6-phosphogluconolactonase/glucosamine-6-phosphate isomerase/deaminase
MDQDTQSCSAIASRILGAAGHAARAGKRFTLAVSPAAITAQAVEALVLARPVLGDFHVFLADTRFEGSGHTAASLRALLERLPLRPGQLHLDVADHGDPERAASAYEQELRAFFGLAIGALPRFSGIVLQLAGGGVASLLSNSPALGETSRLATPNRSGGERFVTLTPPVIQNAASVFVMADAKSAAERSACAMTGRLLDASNVTLLVGKTN